MFSLRIFKVALIVTAMCLANFTFGQQPQSPSQRFEPVRNVPPSVHVPPTGQVRNLRQTGPAAQPHQATTYNFSDTGQAAFRRAMPQRQARNNDVRQVTYEQPVEPKVPAVLQSQPGKSPIETFGSKPMTLESLRPPAAATATPIAAQPISAAAPAVRAPAAPPQGNQIVVDQQHFVAAQQAQQNRESMVRQMKQSQPHVSQNSNVMQVAYEEEGTEPESEVTHAAEIHTAELNPLQSAAPISSSENIQTSLRQVSSSSELVGGASVSLATPGIVVQTFGPTAIGINKLSNYKITITNNTNLEAGKLSIGIQIPDTVDLQNINTTIGRHDTTDGVEEPRLIWTVDNVAPQTTHTMGITAVPRTADPFDMQVRWSFAPQIGSTHVRVTKPQLAMKISGPTELLFGEKAIYDVTILNPGKGAAEQVTVALPEALGGERELIGDIPAGGEKRFNVELSARTAGSLSLTTTAFAEGNIKTTANHDIIVRRANLAMTIDGPPMKYAGSVGQYHVTVQNTGDATAADVVGIIALPSGVKYISGVNNAQSSDSGLKWNIGTMTAGDTRDFKINCQLDAAGDLMIQAGVRGAGDLAATSQSQTTVETIADLVLSVADPKGPLPTGDQIDYKISVKNRGTRTANGVNLVMQFSEGIEPVKADGFRNKIATGQVIFDPIVRIEPGQEVILSVTASAIKSGTHIFRAQLTCTESDSREIAEGTTRFFGDAVKVKAQQIDIPFKANTADATSGTNDFK